MNTLSVEEIVTKVNSAGTTVNVVVGTVIERYKLLDDLLKKIPFAAGALSEKNGSRLVLANKSVIFIFDKSWLDSRPEVKIKGLVGLKSATEEKIVDRKSLYPQTNKSP